MKRSQTVFVSNRLAVRVSRSADGLEYTPSVGGLATGLSSVASDDGSTLWIGWSGLPSDELSPEERREIEATLRDEYHAVPVDVSSRDLELFYSGFCNDTVWPLF
ncbi:MAG: trehalose-6-phosphate synthase, partial [Alkalispirochaeta sp.]